MASTRAKRRKSCLGCLGLLVVLAAVLLPLLYLEEDWRGAHDLVAAKQRWRDAGYSLTAEDYYPPPVPDDQNLAALPIFQTEPNPAWNGQLWDKRLHDAMDEDAHGGEIYDYEHKQDLSTLVGKAYTKEFPGKTAPASRLAQFEELYPVIVDIRAAAVTRRAFRLNQDYGHQPPWDRPLGPVTDQIKVAKFFSYDTQLALKENQPQVAVDDIKCAFLIARGMGTDPSLVGGLVSLGISAITRANVDDGLSKHIWNDAELVQIQDELKKTDCLAIYQFAIRSEPAVHSLPMFELSKGQSSTMKLLVGMATESESHGSIWAVMLWHLWASGWWDMNAAKMANLMLNNAECVDIKGRLVDVKRNEQLKVEVEKEKELPWGAAPWTLLYAVAGGPMTNALEKFAQRQVQLDEDRIVCALERYRLARGAYPDKLEALAPAYIDELPHDVMNGEPYRYRLNPDGTFLLYSVGWNQVDDGGKFAFRADSSKAIDFTQGDWVWPMVKR
ncbi:MAG TPA: hypothetical protein VHY09_03450 [Candidatus Methylacidiphilales bacterium]|nr:hypothetical protein [Candidatus Methylacidiphilales bacterium]